jgi:hypothetical protein
MVSDGVTSPFFSGKLESEELKQKGYAEVEPPEAEVQPRHDALQTERKWHNQLNMGCVPNMLPSKNPFLYQISLSYNETWMNLKKQRRSL